MKNIHVKKILSVIALLVITLVLPSAGECLPSAPRGETVEVRVLRIVDGDTIRVDFPVLGDTSVRFIGIDTPESKKNSRAELQSREERKNVETIVSMGKRASKHLGSMVRRGDTVILEFDATKQDKYGRILAYVWKDGKMLNARMVADGYAYPLTIAPNVKYADVFVSLFREAQEKGKGLWGR